MEFFRRYTRILLIYYKTFLLRDMKFRLSFLTGVIGAFCYVGLYFFTIFFLMKKISIGRWGTEEMWVLLGCFYVIIYAYFFLFWRGFLLLISSIRNGQFDAYLLKPIDTQFLVASTGGRIHNLLSMLFGIFVLIWSALKFASNITIIRAILVPLVIGLSVVDLFSFAMLLITLNFKFGYLDEIMVFVNSFQDFTRYPSDAFTKLPIYLLVLALPFSALTTMPALLIIETSFPLIPLLLFSLASIGFFLISRYVFYNSIKHYTSGS